VFSGVQDFAPNLLQLSAHSEIGFPLTTVEYLTPILH